MTTEWKPKPGDRVRVVCDTEGKPSAIDGAEARYIGEVVGARTHPHCVSVDGDDGARTVVHSVGPIEPEWQVGDACETLWNGEWCCGGKVAAVHDVARECCVTGVPGKEWKWVKMMDMRRSQTVEPDPVDAIRREVEALRTRVADLEAAHGWPSEDAEPGVVHVWSDGTVGPTRPIAEADIGKPLPSVRTVSAEELARELAAMTERAEVAERDLAGIVRRASGALQTMTAAIGADAQDDVEEMARRMVSQLKAATGLLDARDVELRACMRGRDEALRRYAALREAVCEALGEAE